MCQSLFSNGALLFKAINIFYHRCYYILPNFALMKFLATIFLFYFSLLIAQPSITLLHSRGMKENKACTMTCCQKKQSQKQQAPKSPFGCCNSDMSNPFAQYCCCVGFIPQQQHNSVTLISNETMLVYPDNNALIPSYSSACWRPPEVTV
jgi:hypothetical protein